MKYALILLIFIPVIILFTVIGTMRSTDPVVMLRNGEVRGAKATDGDYSEFLGIPYAVVDPENPFGNAKPQPDFDGVFYAHTDNPGCPRRSFSSEDILGTLDCLTVNVYVPQSASTSNKLPVMVWIFGGGFTGGSSSKDLVGPQYLVRHDVILVAMNYRVGPYGFMCLNIPSVPGNTGLKDQQLALQWVHDNIEAFGGDADKVTIFGQSAGAGSCHYHILNPVSNQLFSQAILQSATVFTDGIIEKPDPTVPFQLTQNMRLNPDTIEEALEMLKNSSIDDVLLAGKDFEFHYYKPCIEEQFDGVEGFIVESPQKTLESKNYRGIPMMIGHNSCENENGSPFGGFKDIRSTLDGRFDFINGSQLETAFTLVRDFYLGRETNTDEDRPGLINWDSDFTYNYGTDKSIKYHLTQADEPIYQFVFGYVGSRSNSTCGVSHGGELSYLFQQPDNENTAADQIVIDKFTQMWANFAKYGNPTPEITELLPVQWPAVTDEKRHYMWIDTELRVGQKLFHDRMAFWDLFYILFGKYYWLY